MAYIDIDYYRNDYEGVPVSDDAELSRLIKRASRDIDSLTQYRIGDLTTQSTVIQGYVKTATAMQVEHLNEYGELASSDASNDGGGFRIGSYSETGGSSQGAYTGRYPSGVIDILNRTGFLYRGVSVRPLYPWRGLDCD